MYNDLREKLEQQRVREWVEWGDALKTQAETFAAATPGLAVPVEIHIDTAPARRSYPEPVDGLTQRWIDNAVEATPSPAELPETPLERLEANKCLSPRPPRRLPRASSVHGHQL